MAAFAGLSRGVKIFLAVDVVLVLALLVAAVVVLGGGDRTADDTGSRPAPATTGPTATDPSAEPDDQETAAGDARSFASPSGNIACTMSADGVTCTIANKQFDVPAAEGCTGTTGHVIVLNESDGVTTPCVEGAPPTVASADTPVLDYGRSQELGPYTCTSGTDGMSCVATETGTGFRVATAALTTLP